MSEIVVGRAIPESAAAPAAAVPAAGPASTGAAPAAARRQRLLLLAMALMLAGFATAYWLTRQQVAEISGE